MKRALMILLALALLLPAALAESMTVVNCNEWVSLRKSPDTASQRLKKVPLNAEVENCEAAENGFIRCDYDGATGYILEKYLESATGDDWTESRYGYSIEAHRRFDASNERLTVTCKNDKGETLWQTDTAAGEPAQFDLTSAFMGGTADDPRVLIYNNREGLYSYSAKDQTLMWTLMWIPGDVSLGAGIRHAVNDQGRMVIIGFDGPDPVCIDNDGKVLWQSDTGDPEIFWPYEIAFTQSGVEVKYENAHDSTGTVTFDINDGHVLDVHIE